MCRVADVFTRCVVSNRLFANELTNRTRDIDTGQDRETQERFTELLRQNAQSLRAFVFSLIPQQEAVDEILQESSIAMWRKFGDLHDESGFLKWAFAVIYYELLVYRRKKARSKLFFDTELLEQITAETTKEDGYFQYQWEAFRQCYSRLDADDQASLTKVYQEGSTIREAAISEGKSPDAYYKYLRRLRTRLANCVARQLKELDL